MTAWTFTGVALLRERAAPVFLAAVNWPKRLWACNSEHPGQSVAPTADQGSFPDRPPQGAVHKPPGVGTPMRVQRRRAKGSKLPDSTVVVMRPTKYGNPYYPGCGLGFGGFDTDMRPVHWRLENNADAVRHYSEYMRLMKRDQPNDFDELVKPPRGRNLACWCPLCPEHQNGRPLGIACEACEPCHVDILLPLANG